MVRLSSRAFPRIISDAKTHICPPLRIEASKYSLRAGPQPPSTLTHRRRMSSSIPALAKPRVFPTSGFDIIDASDRVEEETLPTYAPDKYYPIHIGELLDARYQVLVNLGYGVTSTVWLCRDLVYVAIPCSLRMVYMNYTKSLS